VFSMLKYEDNDITEFGRVTLHAALNPADEKAQEALEKLQQELHDDGENWQEKAAKELEKRKRRLSKGLA
ncbi:unnamed protein product, partial [Symbiodinium sp. KB8]